MSIYLRQTYTPTLQTPAISQPLRGSCMAGYNFSCLTAFCHATHLLSVELQSYNEFGKQPNHCVDFWLIMGKCLDWQIAVAFGKQSSSTRKKTLSQKKRSYGVIFYSFSSISSRMVKVCGSERGVFGNEHFGVR